MTSIKNWLSRYGWRYPRSLVYMLQASEYNVRDYFKWYHRTKNFNDVERRKRLVFTPKAILLLAVAWIILLAVYAAAAAIFLFILSLRAPTAVAGEAISVIASLGPLAASEAWREAILPLIAEIAASRLLSGLAMTAGVLIFLSAPYFLAYLLAAKALFLKIFFQTPAEYFIIRRARKKLAAREGFKIAIAGSYGKTTMREILKTVLSAGKKTAAPSENYNTPIGVSRFIKNLKGDEEVLIFELGEYYPGDVRRLCRLIQPQLGIITGVNEAHLEKFKNLDKTADTVFELAEELGELPIYINGESDLAKTRAPEGAVIYTKKGAGDWRVENPRTDLSGVSFEIVSSVIASPGPLAASEAWREVISPSSTEIASLRLAMTGELSSLRAPQGEAISRHCEPRRGEAISVKIHSQLLGLHQIGPLAAAADIAFHLGMSPEEIRRGLNNVKPIKHRIEPRTDAAGVTIIDDSYNGNPDGAAAAVDFLGSLKLPPGGRRFYVTPGLVEMGMAAEPAHLKIGEKLAKVGIEAVILIKTSVSSYIKQGLVGNGYQGEIMEFDDMPAALAALPYLTVRGDVVLIQNDWPDQYQ